MERIFKIHPAIGVARMGKSNKDEYYLAPEVPGQIPNQNKQYKIDGKIKRQAQRFRIYEYENIGGVEVPIREMTLENASIKWEVELVNRKAALRQTFFPAEPRNVGSSEDELIIEDSKKIIAPSDPVPLTGEFRNESVNLGYAKMTDAGRLLIVGSDGESGSVPQQAPLPSFCNNDDWYDSTADGIIRAILEIQGEQYTDIAEARVICSSPAFAPEIDNVTTLYDVAFQASTQLGTPGMDVWKPSFYKDILPILKRTVILQWVSSSAKNYHGENTSGEFTETEQFKLLANSNQYPNSPAYKRRRIIFSKLRTPSGSMPPVNPPANVYPSMPALNDGLTVTSIQYELMRKWSLGEFTNDPIPPQPEAISDEVPVEEQPMLLDRAALEACIGGPFYPGIESWHIMSEPSTFSEPIRIASSIKPGFLTIGNALPWQADYTACGIGWWPAQRPNDVSRKDEHGNITHDNA